MNPNMDFREHVEWGDSTIDRNTPPRFNEFLHALGWLVILGVAAVFCVGFSI